jgi:ankyrin repeat protein
MDVIRLVRNNDAAAIQQLIDDGYDVSECVNAKYNLLTIACKCGNVNVAKLLMKHGAKIDTYLFKHIAIAEYCIDAVEYLISLGLDINQPDPSGVTPLFYACKYNNTLLVELLLKHHVNVNVECNGVTPLLAACRKRNYKLIQLLLDHGADVNVKDDYGNIPASYLMSIKDDKALIIALRKGNNANHMDNNGIPLLITAISKDNSLAVRALLKHGANVNWRDDSGRTPLMYACRKGLISISHILINAGANINAQDDYGNTAALYSVMYPTSDNFNLFNMLMERGADGMHRNRKGMSPLHLFRIQKKQQAVK